VGVVCWERSYRGGTLVSNEERRTVVAKGMDAMKKALAIDPTYFEALSYQNLLYREQGKMLQAYGDYDGAKESFVSADEFLKKALEVRKKATLGAKKS
jgi:hypothetical protein